MNTSHHESAVLPLRRDTPKFLRVRRAIKRVAGWCSWRCPLLAFLLVLAAHAFPTPPWFRLVCDTLVAALVLLLFCSYGFSIAADAIAVQRERRRSERLGLFFGVLAGLGLAALGILGVWAFLRSVLLDL